MAGSSIVGILKVLLTADTAAFTSGLDGAATSTKQFTGQLTGMATQVSSIGNMLGRLFTVTAITAAAKQVMDYAGNIQDLAEQTGLTVEAIQEMGFAAKQTGSNLESFTNAAFKLGTNLAEGTTKARDSVRALGLSYEALNASSPSEQFKAVAEALSRVEDVQERNRLGVILMGKGYRETAAAINEGYDELALRAGKSSAEQIKALSDAGDAWDRLKDKVMNLGVLIAGSFAQSMESLGVALRQDAEFLNQYVGIIRITTQAFEDWGTILGKAAEAPKVMTAAMKNLPAPLQAVNISTEEQEKRMKALEAQHGRVSTSTRSVGVAQEEVDENIQRLTSSLESQIAAFRRTNTIAGSVHESFRLMRVDFTETIPVLQNLTTLGFEPFKASLTASGTAIRTWADTAKDIFGGVSQAIVNAIQGGGSIIAAAGASIGTSLMSKFQEKFGPAIKAALPFGIGEAVTALLPTLGALFGPIAEKIGGFFRKIFGGPSAEEMKGRQAVAAFEEELQGLLTQTQRNEAGNEEWKMTVIAIRDAYLAAGKTEAEAMAAAERLWASSKKGASETEAAIKAIQSVLDQTKAKTDELGDVMDRTFRDREFTVTEDRVLNENVYRNFNDIDDPEGFGTGTLGRLGKWFGNFPKTGMATVLHGAEAVVTPGQAPAFAMDVLGANAAFGQSAQQRPAAQTPLNVHSTIENRLFMDGRELKNWISDAITTAIENNERGIRSRLRDGLGVTT